MNSADLNGKTILVTGGCGFIGSNFIELVLSEFTNLTVINVDYLGIGSRADFNPVPGGSNTYEHVYAGTQQLAWMPTILQGKMFDYVFHFAAESHVDRSINSPSDFIIRNVSGMTGVLEYVRLFSPQARLINISTDEVYGHLCLDTDDVFTELSPLQPRSPYSASKASADLIANSYHTTYGLDVITTRCCNNFGPNQHDEKLIPTVIRHLNAGRKVPVYGRGENIREWIYVDDHNRSILEIAKIGKAGNVYNVTGEESLTNLEMIASILELIHPSEKFPTSYMKYVEFIEDRKGHDLRYALESVNYNRSFNLTSFYDSLKTTVDFYIGKYQSAD